jgi:prepilin peptidase CpaA
MEHSLAPLMSLGFFAAAASLLVIAALRDFATRTVPNWMPLSIALCGIILRILNGGLPAAFLVGLAVFFVAALCWRRGWMGGADVKLLASTTMLSPPHNVPALLLAVAVAGGVLAGLYIVGRHVAFRVTKPRSHTFPSRVLRAELWRMTRGAPLPYACAIAAGSLFTIL